MSVPKMRRCGAYCGSEMPVPTPTSSTRPPILLVAAMAALRPLLNTPPNTRSYTGAQRS